MTTDIFFVHLSQKSAYEWIISSRHDLLHRQDAEKHNEQRGSCNKNHSANFALFYIQKAFQCKSVSE